MVCTAVSVVRAIQMNYVSVDNSDVEVSYLKFAASRPNQLAPYTR